MVQKISPSSRVFFFQVIFLALGICVQVFAGGAKETEWQAVEGGESWQHELDLTELEPGVYNVIVRGRDLAGNETIEGPFNLRVDPNSDLPTARTVFPAENEVVRGNINIVGIAVDDDAVSHVEVQIDDGGFVRADGSEYWRAYTEAALVQDGTHTITIQPVDINGLPGPVQTSKFILDTTAPSIELTSHESGDIVGGTVVFQGLASDANGISQVRLRIPAHEKLTGRGAESVEETVQNLRSRIDRQTGTANFDFRVNTRELADGPYIYWLTAVDQTGTELEAPFLFFVDNVSPEIQILNPEPETAVHGRASITGSIRDQVGIERFWYIFDGEEVDIPLTPGNPYWTVDLKVNHLTGRNIDLEFLALDSSGNTSRLRYRLANDREGARPTIVLHQPPAPEDARQPRTVAAGDRLFGRIEGVNEASLLRVTGLDPADARAVREFPARFGFSLPIDLPPGRRSLTLTAVDALGYESQAQRIDLLVRAPEPEILLESLVYTGRNDDRGAQDWYGGIEFDRLSTAVVQGTIRTTAKLSSAVALIGSQALSLSTDAPGSELRPVRLATRAVDGGFSFELPLAQDLGFGPQPLRIRVEDEFGTTTVLTSFVVYRDIRRLEAEPAIVLEQSRFSDGVLYFGNDRAATGRVLTRAAGSQGESLRSLRLIYPDAETEVAGPTQQNVVRLVARGVFFDLVPGAEGRVDGLVVEAEIAQDVFVRSSPFAVVVDSDAPEITVNNGEGAGIQLNPPAEGQTLRLALSGTIREPNGLRRAEYSVDGGTSFAPLEPRTSGQGDYSFSLNHDFGDRPQGAYGLVIRAVDRSGNTRTLSRVLNARTPEPLPVVDAESSRRNDKPRLELLVPGRGGLLMAGSDAVISGLIEDLDGASALEMEGADGQFSRVQGFDSRQHYQPFSVSVDHLPPGTHSITLRAVDRFAGEEPGVSSELTVRLTIASHRTDIQTDGFEAGSVLALGETHTLTGNLSGADRLRTMTWEIPGVDDGNVSTSNTDDPLVKTFSLRLPNSLSYQKEPHLLLLRAEDSEGRTVERSIPFFVAHPDPAPRPSQDLVFFDDRLVGRQIRFDAQAPMFAWFDGPPLASAQILWASSEGPASPDGESRFENGLELGLVQRPLARVSLVDGGVRLDPQNSGSAEDFHILLTDVDGVEYRIGPYGMLVDTEAPETAILAPLQDSYHSEAPVLEFSASDDSPGPASELRFSYRLNGQGEWRGITPSQTNPRQPAAAPSGSGATEPETDPGDAAAPTDAAVETAAETAAEAGSNPSSASGSDSSASFFATISMAGIEPGVQRVELLVEDAMGKRSIQEVSFFYDNAAPVIEFLTPVSTDAVNGRTLVSGRILSPSPVDRIRHRVGEDDYIQLGADRIFSVEVDFSELVNRELDWELEVRDMAGNISTASPTALVDLEADFPTVEVQIPEEGSVQAEDFTVSGMAFDDDRIQEIHWRLDEGEWQQLPGGNSFFLDFSLHDLTDNEHTIEVYAVDMFGLTGPTVGRSFRVSLREPVIGLTSPQVDDTNSGTILLEGTAQDENGISEVSLSLDNGTSFYTVEGTDSWSYALDSTVFTDGTYSVQIRAVDGYGIEGQYFTLVNVDNTPPELQIDAPAEASEVSGSISLTGRVTDNTRVSSLSAVLEPINGESEAVVLELSTDTIVQDEVDLSNLEPGWYNLRFTAVDPADNATSLDRNILVKEEILTNSVSILFPLQGETHHGQVVVEGRVQSAQPVRQAQIYVGGELMGTAEVTDLGYFKTLVDSASLREGANTVQAVIEPRAGERTESSIRQFEFHRIGPFVSIDSHSIGDFVANRPWLSGTVGYTHDLDPEDRENKDAIRGYEVETLQVSLDNGRTFQTIRPDAQWRYRIETGELPPGPLAVIVQAVYRNGEQTAVRSLYTVDKTIPELSLLSPVEGSLLNTSVLFQGTASDDFGLESLEISLRPGDKAGYSVPEFIQGMYLDLDLWGLTYWKAGLGFTFFDEAVKLQANFGVGPDEVTPGVQARLSGYFIGGKLLANIFTLPFNALFGPDWTWLSLNFAIGADFSYILLYDPIEQTDPVTDETTEIPGVVLSAIVFQLEFPKVHIESWQAFNTFSFYTEPEIWFIPSDVDPKVEFKLTFGFRIGLF